MSLIIQVPQDLYQKIDLHSTQHNPTTSHHTKKIDIEYVAQHVDIVELALEYGLNLIEQTSGDYICLCPFHADRETPSMRIYTVTNTWHCFGCNQGSSVFDFVMLQDDISFEQSLLKLAARVGYTGTYVLKEINVDSINDRFTEIRLKIERMILKKYLNIAEDIEISRAFDFEIAYNQVADFWEWYDRNQSIFDKKLWQNADQDILIRKLYEFYTCALRKLNQLKEVCCE